MNVNGQVVNAVQNIVSGTVKVVHTARMQDYTDGALEVTSQLTEAFPQTFTQGQIEMPGIVDIAESMEGDGSEVKGYWTGFEN